MPSNPLTNINLEKYYQNEPKFNGVYSRNKVWCISNKYLMSMNQ